MVGNKAFFKNLILKSVLNSGVRGFAIFISVLFGSAVCAAFVNIYADIDKKVSSELNSYGANVVISPVNLETPYIKLSDLESKFSNIKELKAKNEYLFGGVNLGVNHGIIMGTNFSSLRSIMPYLDLKSGEFVNVDFDDKNALIGTDLSKLIGVKVGDNVEISANGSNKTYKVKIKGIVFSGEKEDGLLLISLNLAQEILGKNGLVNYAQAIIGGDFKSVNNICKIASSDKFTFEPIGKISKAKGQILEKIKLLMVLIGLTILLISSVCVNTSLSSILLSKIKEFALIRALGASKKDVLKLIFFEVALITFVGSILGALFGYILAIFLGHLIFQSGVDFRFISLIIAVCLSLFFAFLASFYPVKKALNASVANLLKEI